MVFPRWICFLAALVLFGCVGAPPGEATEPSSGPRSTDGLSAVLRSNTDSDRMSLVAKCGWEIESGGEFCSESAGPEPGYVTASPGHRLAVRLSRWANRVRADIVKREDGETTEQYPGAIKATVVPGSQHRRWRFKLPADLEDANAILIGATYRPAVRDGGDRVRSAYFLSKFRLPG